MSPETHDKPNNESAKGADASPIVVTRAPGWVGPVVFLLIVAVVVALGLLYSSIMERRREAQAPPLVVKPLPEWEPDNAVWGENYPYEYESYLRSKTSDAQHETRYGGSLPKSYLDADPRLVILWTGYAFSKEYAEPRGHYYSMQDVTSTPRITLDPQAAWATCFTCKSTDVPRMMAKVGVDEFYHSKFPDLETEVTHPIGCQDCHDPATMNLRITRPALRDALGEEYINNASHQEMRSLVCAQCHVEYYFAATDRNPKDKYHLTFPWKDGTDAEPIVAYYDDKQQFPAERYGDWGFVDFVNPISGTPMIKAQHPDYELYLTGVHNYRDVSCADCHMPYRTEGAIKYTDHHVQSPLLNIANSCAVCHRWSEDEIKQRVYDIQDKVWNAKLQAEDAMVLAHFDIAAARQAGATDDELRRPRERLRDAQFKWDYIRSSNSMGFHSPQESMRLLGVATDEAQQIRVELARLLGKKGYTDPVQYPDISTRDKAVTVMKAFESGQPINLLPPKDNP